MPTLSQVSGVLRENKRIEPSIQIVIDCKGERVTSQYLWWAEAQAGKFYGFDSDHVFWVTRTDLLHDLIASGMEQRIVDRRIADEPRHEPSFDLYRDGGIVPVLRLVNIAPARRWDEMPSLQEKP